MLYFGFGHAEHADVAILRFWDFRQNSEFGHLRQIFPSKEHLWTLRAIFSNKKLINGLYGPYISSRKPIYGPCGPDMSGTKSTYGP